MPTTSEPLLTTPSSPVDYTESQTVEVSVRLQPKSEDFITRLLLSLFTVQLLFGPSRIMITHLHHEYRYIVSTKYRVEKAVI